MDNKWNFEWTRPDKGNLDQPDDCQFGRDYLVLSSPTADQTWLSFDRETELAGNLGSAFPEEPASVSLFREKCYTITDTWYNMSLGDYTNKEETIGSTKSQIGTPGKF